MSEQAFDAISLLHRTITRHHHERDNQVDPRLVAAEAVAACALHLVNQWTAWQALNAVALAAIPGEPDTLAEDLAQLGQDREGAMAALAAYELLDAAVQVWTPHAHPGVTRHDPETADIPR